MLALHRVRWPSRPPRPYCRSAALCQRGRDFRGAVVRPTAGPSAARDGSASRLRTSLCGRSSGWRFPSPRHMA
eukprot:984448-Pyramimonas_sp.AAC.1